MDNTSYPCPSCGFLVFSEPPGSYEICPFCDWEDDHVQLSHPLMAGGANQRSLVESQQTALRQLPLAIVEHKGVQRARKWRPLQEQDLIGQTDAPKNGISYFHAAGGESAGYYWDRDAGS